MSKKQKEIQDHMEKFHTDKEAMKAEMVAKDQDFSTMKGNLALMETQKNQIVAELAAKNETMTNLTKQLDHTISQAMSALRQTQGGLEDSMNNQFQVVKTRLEGIEARLQEASNVVAGLDGRIVALERNSGSRDGGGFTGGAGSDNRYRDLISVKDMKLPILADANPSVMVFRKWYKDLSK